MPLYDYVCTKCGQKFEQISGFNDKTVNCIFCGSQSNRIISNTNFILNGDGWAKDNYHKSNKKSEKTE